MEAKSYPSSQAPYQPPKPLSKQSKQDGQCNSDAIAKIRQ